MSDSAKGDEANQHHKPAYEEEGVCTGAHRNRFSAADAQKYGKMIDAARAGTPPLPPAGPAQPKKPRGAKFNFGTLRLEGHANVTAYLHAVSLTTPPLLLCSHPPPLHQ